MPPELTDPTGITPPKGNGFTVPTWVLALVGGGVAGGGVQGVTIATNASAVDTEHAVFEMRLTRVEVDVQRCLTKGEDVSAVLEQLDRKLERLCLIEGLDRNCE